MTKTWLVFGLILAFAAPVSMAQSRKGTARWRNNVNLPGGDYLSIDMDTADPSGCRAACEKDGRCKAWTFVKPEQPGGRGYCWLKDSVPEATREECCVSALKGEGSSGAAVIASTLPKWRDNVNLPGGDFLSIDMTGTDPAPCQAACEKESRCKAWTYVKPEEPGGRGYCWLKDSVPEAIVENCCVSALKGAGTSTASGWAVGWGSRKVATWRNNINLPGADFLAIDMTGDDPGPCQAACEKDGRCKAWTFVKPEEPGGRSYCWLKDSVPTAVREECCVSALKGEGGASPRRDDRRGRTK
ncbi:PAN domain-containing protein [Paludibaculum fermentans]|uniref:PAN domain-containing protein n=1 Tax=Paludibaculum fermentans TaxID=1473598 RepID=UPI003EBB2A43